MTTKIEWSDDTWNPTTGCTKISPGCANCYLPRTAAFRIAGRQFVKGHIPIQLHPERLALPIHWREPRRVFVDSMSDLFHDDVPDEFIDKVFGVTTLAGAHQFLVLTKRPERMRAYFTAPGRGIDICRAACPYWPNGPLAAFADLVGPDILPLDNVWLGVTAENQRMANARVPELLQTPAAVRFVSLEPLLAPLTLRCIDLGVKVTKGYGRRRVAWDALSGWEVQGHPDKPIPDRLSGRSAASCQHPALDWVIVGGESGPRRRPMDLAWARSLREQCRAAGVAFFMKQLGGPRAGTALEALPEDLQIREYPR